MNKTKPIRTSLLLILLAGDLITLLLFVLIGRSDHGMAFSWRESMPTAVPFAAAWIAASFALGGYRERAISSPTQSIISVLLVCCLAVPLGLAIRSLWLDRLPGGMFALVAYPLTAAFMCLWRLLFTYIKLRLFKA